ncbi:hypothetical protein E2C01_076046 [Portunus trituberculatus]|uniref:Uncharacterized protein n=1 Tax=Portunus trituberculatus TaxID=210409 RepID=A0A5B7IAD4_PORTR|nr:hypothetical protein [Portunus trituberculatus]
MKQCPETHEEVPCNAKNLTHSTLLLSRLRCSMRRVVLPCDSQEDTRWVTRLTCRPAGSIWPRPNEVKERRLCSLMHHGS